MDSLPESLRYVVRTEEELLQIIEGVQDETEMTDNVSPAQSDSD